MLLEHSKNFPVQKRINGRGEDLWMRYSMGEHTLSLKMNYLWGCNTII
jgi:hypothetical protein